MLTRQNLVNGAVNAGVNTLLGAGNLFTLGNVFYVDSGIGSNGNSGKEPDAPKASVDSAIGACVTIVGLGYGLARPTFTYGAAAATITVSGANCVWRNCHFIGNFDNVAAAFTLGAAKNFTLENNTFVDNSAALHFLSIVVTGATDNDADSLTVVGNSWQALALAPNAFISILAAEKWVYIADNHCDMAATNDVGHFLTIAAKVMTGIRILRNILVVVGATDAAVGIFVTGSSTTNTGVVAYNLVNSLDTTSELIMTAALNLAQFENYYTGTITATGKLWPAVDGA